MYNRERVLNSHWDIVVSLMDNEKREQIHRELAPCTNEDFLDRYLEIDPEFEFMLNSEF